MHTPRFLTMLHVRLTITKTAVAFWTNGSFAEHVLWEISGACVDTKLRGSLQVNSNKDNFWVVPLFRHLGMWFTLVLEGGEYID